MDFFVISLKIHHHTCFLLYSLLNISQQWIYHINTVIMIQAANNSVSVNFAFSHLLPFTSSDFNNPCQTTNSPNYLHDTEAFKEQTESQLSFSNYKRKLSSWTNIISTLDNLYSWACILILTQPARTVIWACCFVQIDSHDYQANDCNCDERTQHFSTKR